ncbi:MAG: sulfatase-like hydrolase/transferase, partial [Halanaerobiales bacterium]
MQGKPDILIFMSDQHNARMSAYAGDPYLRTPNLDRLAKDGVTFDAAYTACPLCVPARTAMLTGQLPSKTGVFSNYGAIAEDQATFVHSLAANGYETVLCGRMHFMGEDQRHGFTKRIMSDLTANYWGTNKIEGNGFGAYKGTAWDRGCLNLIGGGTSPVLEYDRQVIKAALNYLENDYDKPQLLVVGLYAPHFPYAAPEDLYKYYLDKIEIDESDIDIDFHGETLKNREISADINTIKKARAAYYGMVENVDQQLGVVRDEWDNYLNRNNRKGLFVYLSDHGDQVGKKNLYGKMTFYEGSARIPLIIQGDGINKNIRISSPASIMDLGPTLCQLTGAQTPPEQDGHSLKNLMNSAEEDVDSFVFSEVIDKNQEGDLITGRMIRKGCWKYIKYAFKNEDYLFNLKDDPGENINLIDSYPDKVKELSSLLEENWNPEEIIKRHHIKNKHFEILDKWGQVVKPDEPER